MSLNTVQEIERAIGALSPQELEELYSWLDQYQPQPIDARLFVRSCGGPSRQSHPTRFGRGKKGQVQPL